MPFDPYAGYNAGLQNLGKAFMNERENRREDEQNARRNSLVDLQTKTGQFNLDEAQRKQTEDIDLKKSLAAPQPTDRPKMSITQLTLEHARKTGNGELYQQTMNKALDESAKYVALTGNPKAGVDYINSVTGSNYEYLGTKDNIVHLKEGESILAYDPVKKTTSVLATGNPKPNPETLLDKRLAAQAEAQRLSLEAADRRTQAQIAAADRRAAQQGGSAGSKLSPGYRWTADGNQEAIPGGPADVKNETKRQGVENAKAAIDLSINTTEKLINHPGRKMATGKSRMTGISKIPGTDSYDFDKELESFDAQLFLSNISSMKGMGALSNAEGAKVSAAAGAIKPGMSEKAFLDNITGIQAALKKAKERIDSGKLINPDGSPQAPDAKAGAAKPPQGPKVGTVENGYRYKGGNPASPSNWVKVGK